MKKPFSHLLSRPVSAAISVALFSLLPGQCVLAAPKTWDGSESFDWGNVDNWNPSGVPAAADTLTFDLTGANFTAIVLGSAEREVASITFSGANSYNVHTADDTSFTTRRRLLVNGGITVSSGFHTITGNGGSGLVSDIRLAAQSISISSDASLNLNAKLGQRFSSDNYSKTGAGTLILSRDSGGSTSWNFSGVFTVSDGTLKFAHNRAGGISSNDFTVSNGATLELAAAAIEQRDAPLTLNGSGVGGIGAFHASETASFNNGTGSIVLNTASSIGVAAAKTLTISQDITGSGTSHLTKVGDGTLTFNGANTYTGNTVVSAGTLSLASGAQLVFATGTTSGINNSITGAGTVTLSGNFLIDTTLTDATALTSGTWQIENVPSLAGPYGESFTVVGWTNASGDTWTKSVGGKNYSFNETTGTVTLTGAGGYSSWKGPNAGGQDPSFDWDNDGVSNGVEYFMGAVPGYTANPALGMGNIITWTNGGNFPTSAYGTRYLVQTSGDLVNWTNIPAENLTANTSGPGGSLTYTLTGSGPRFVRLKVTPN